MLEEGLKALSDLTGPLGGTSEPLKKVFFFELFELP